MRHKHGEERNQLLMFSLESSIASNSFVRVVDVFVDSIDLKSFGFNHVVCHSEGCPPYHPAALLNLDSMDVLADKGYHTGDHIQSCAENNITEELLTAVSMPEPWRKTQKE